MRHKIDLSNFAKMKCVLVFDSQTISCVCFVFYQILSEFSQKGENANEFRPFQWN